MLTKIFAATVLLFAGCIDDGIGGSPGSLPIDDPNPTDGGTPIKPTAFSATFDPGSPPRPPLCELLPKDDSACAHACDPVALVGYIPEGTCATFSCPLTDGTHYLTGGCN